jgi:hypothetical protein
MFGSSNSFDLHITQRGSHMKISPLARFTLIFATFLPSVVQAGIYMSPSVSVSGDTENPNATITVDVYVGSDNGAGENLLDYFYNLRMSEITPAIPSYVLTAPTAVTTGVWSVGNFTTVSATSDSNSFTFSGSTTGGPSAFIPFVAPFTSDKILGTASFTMARPAFGFPDASYTLGGSIEAPLPYVFTGPSGNLPITFAFANFSVAAVSVPEPSTYAMALAGLACGGYLVKGRRKRA